MKPRRLVWLATVLWGFVVTSLAAFGLLVVVDRAGPQPKVVPGSM